METLKRESDPFPLEKIKTIIQNLKEDRVL